MPATTLNATFDGVNDVTTLNGTQSWDSGFIGYYSQYEGDPNNNLVANLDLTGSNWTVSALRIGAASQDTMLTLSDLDGGGGRRINYLQLGYNSDVDLISTRVDYILGWDGALHDITLGSANTRAVNLYANQNIVTTGTGYVGEIEANGVNTFTINGEVGSINSGNFDDTLTMNSGWVGSARLDDGDDTVTMLGSSQIETLSFYSGSNEVTLHDDSRIRSLLADGDNTITIQDNARIQYLNLNLGNQTVTTGDRWFQAMVSWESSNTVNIGTGGAGVLEFNSETLQTHRIEADGYIALLRTNDRSDTSDDDQTTRLILNGDAGSIFLGSGNDRIITGAGYVDFIHASRGNDLFYLGSGGTGFAIGGDGDDTFRVSELSNPNFGTAIQGRSGTDVIDFLDFQTTGVTFSLNENGAYQNVGDPTDITNPVVGYFSEISIENLRGTTLNDHFTGDNGANLFISRGGDDTMLGGNGEDTLLGGNGDDDLMGQNDADRLVGGTGQDTLIGGAGNDLLIGEGNEDHMNGGDDMDTLIGGNANDTLFGGDGADRLLGDAGIDRLVGGMGDDILFGGVGRDVFVFGTGDGFDDVRDFQDGFDTFEISGHTGGFATLSIYDVGPHLRVDYDGGSFRILNEAGTVLTAADFDFV